jgi:hypothetical protein
LEFGFWGLGVGVDFFLKKGFGVWWLVVGVWGLGLGVCGRGWGVAVGVLFGVWGLGLGVHGL